MLNLSPSRVLPLLALASLVATGCRPEILTSEPGEVLVVYEKDGTQIQTREAELDFGSVFMGSTGDQQLVIRNAGPGRLVLQSLEVVEGGPVRIGDTGDENAPFYIGFEEGFALGVTEVAEFPLTFTPPDSPADVVSYEVTLRLTVENGREGERTATIRLVGLGVKGHCKLPEQLQFGNVGRDDTFRRSIDVRNLSDLPTTAWVSAITSSSGDHNAFNFAPESVTGDFQVEPKQTRQVLIDFKPTENKSYLAFVKMRAAEQCPEQTVTLTGAGVDSTLSWQPAVVDCGYVPPGVEVTRTVTFTNGAINPVELTSIRTEQMNEFRVVHDAAPGPATLTVPGEGGTAELTVACKPALLGPRQTQLRFETSLTRQPTGAILLRAFGGGPDIQVNPSPALNFGRVAYFPGANPPASSQRKLTVMNVGTAPAEPDVKANLRLGELDSSGESTLRYVEIVPLNDDTAQQEFEVTVPESYDHQKGLVAKVGENMVELVVKITPFSVGVKKARLIIYSNDADEPETHIEVTAMAEELPPCDYTVSPTTLNFGLISPPDYRDLAFSIKNNGTAPDQICLLTGLSLTPDTHQFFTLLGGPIEAYEMAPQEQLEVKVRVQPTGTTPAGVTQITGEVEFFMSSLLRPRAVVGLTAQLAPACLTIAPDELDYGTVQVGCASSTRTFNIYNSCPSAVTIHSFGVQAGAGQPAGGPNCPGTQPCPEFILMQTPQVPPGGIVLNTQNPGPVSFQARYKPIDIGSDSGAIAVTATQNGQNVTYVVSLKGRGDTQGIQTDTFTQDLKPKADVLIAIDDSCSMASHQDELAANFDHFIRYAESAGVDYNIAVITTDDTNATKAGRFQFGPSHPEKILTPATLDVKAKFGAKVKVGTGGSGIETCLSPLLKALSAPLVNNENAGFLRDEASLAMICVTDAPDQSNIQATHALQQFWNIKGHNRKTQFSFNAIAPFAPFPAPGCSYDQANSFDDGTYATLVQQTNGVRDEICTPDWSKTLEELGRGGLGFRTNFFLTSVPDLVKGPIEVAIDGIPVPDVDERGATVWVFDSVGNSVNFEPMYVPEPGQTLTINYHTTCYP